MSKPLIARAFLATALLALSPAAMAQDNTTNTANTTDPALATPTTDPLAANTANTTTDPLATDPMATTTTTDPLATDPLATNTTTEREDDDGFPWGLLGLLGLAGLLGAKRRDRDRDVDTRRDTR